MRTSYTRRSFLTSASLALAAPVIIPASALGKNGTVAPSQGIAIALIGCGGRGWYDYEQFLKERDAQCVAVCVRD